MKSRFLPTMSIRDALLIKIVCTDCPRAISGANLTNPNILNLIESQYVVPYGRQPEEGVLLAVTDYGLIHLRQLQLENRLNLTEKQYSNARINHDLVERFIDDLMCPLWHDVFKDSADIMVTITTEEMNKFNIKTT